MYLNKVLLASFISFFSIGLTVSASTSVPVNALSSSATTAAIADDVYTTSVVFPAGFKVGDVINVVRASPLDAGSSGYYEVSISYTRGGIAAAATYIGSVSHSNPGIWRELGRINSNGYAQFGSYGHSFTVDCNSMSYFPSFRIRATNTLGVQEDPLTVHVKIRSINSNASWTPLNETGNDLTVDKFLPMTNDWSLYVGNPFSAASANLAIKADQSGNVGIGTADTKGYKLAVKGNIGAQEIRVENGNWPDYVFHKAYPLLSLQETEKFIQVNGHLPEMPPAAEVKNNGIDLSDMNARLLKKIEELTLHMIQLQKENEKQSQDIKYLKEKLNKK